MQPEGKSNILNTVCFLVLFYIVSVAVLFVSQRNFIYHPDPTVPRASLYGVADMDVITAATEDGLELSAWYGEPQSNDKPVIVLFHGNAGHIGIRAFKARLLMDNGYGFLLAEYRGYGGNDGKPSEQGFYKDGRAYINWLKNQGISEDRIVLYGESIGSGTAVQMAAEFSAAHALILETPFTDLPAVAQRHMIFVPTGLLMKDRFDNGSKIGALNMPVLILHGKRDVVVPYKIGKALFDRATEPKQMETFPHGGHNDLYMHGAGLKILEFLKSLGTRT